MQSLDTITYMGRIHWPIWDGFIDLYEPGVAQLEKPSSNICFDDSFAYVGDKFRKSQAPSFITESELN